MGCRALACLISCHSCLSKSIKAYVSGAFGLFPVKKQKETDAVTKMAAYQMYIFLITTLSSVASVGLISKPSPRKESTSVKGRMEAIESLEEIAFKVRDVIAALPAQKKKVKEYKKRTVSYFS